MKAKEYLSCYELLEQALERETNEQARDEKIKKMQGILLVIYELPKQQHTVLYLRFIEGKSLKEISKAIDRSYDYTRHICGAGLKEIEKKNDIGRLKKASFL